MDTFPRVVQQLRQVLGAKLVAYLGELTQTRQLAPWIAGEVMPPERVQSRLRWALEIAEVLLSRDSAAAVQAWFQGMNPFLGDVSPARVLREAPEEQWEEVLSAARAYVSNSFS